MVDEVLSNLVEAGITEDMAKVVTETVKVAVEELDSTVAVEAAENIPVVAEDLDLKLCRVVKMLLLSIQESHSRLPVLGLTVIKRHHIRY